MKLTNGNRISSTQIEFEVLKIMRLETPTERENAVERFSKKYNFFQDESNKKKRTTFIKRLTYIPFAIPFFLFFAFIYCPLKWIVTGIYYVDYSGTAKKNSPTYFIKKILRYYQFI